jgi:NAD(P)-dependent dehydrogenase (short-subunit alcohol dehydrogenase family)
VPSRRALVTGSSDGIGARIAGLLEAQGVEVVRHARSEDRARDTRAATGGRGEVVIGDLASLASTRSMVAALQQLAPCDVVVHNAGWSSRDERRPVTADGLEQTFQINALAPYLLTAALPLPRRLVWVSSDSIIRGRVDLDDLQHEAAWTSDAAYADSKLAMTALALGIARRCPQVVSNAVHPGWVRTKMAGDAAPLGLDEGADTAVWLAASDDPAVTVSGAFFHERRVVRLNEQAYDDDVQDALLERCAELTGVRLP